MKTWSLPEAYCSIALNHHKKNFDGNDILLVIVRLSDMACKKVGKTIRPDNYISLISLHETQFLSVKEMTLAELEKILKDIEDVAL